MYRYDALDRQLVQERVDQFRDQVRRYLAGELDDVEFRHLRLRNGLYLQRFAPMLRISIPYGLLSSAQVRTLAGIARDFDKGYGHFSTRQNIQFNWPELEKVPDILQRLADTEMHAIQTSGNCVRNITTDHLAGVAPDEVTDPRPYCELTRQWATFHPEFNYLPRKFKIAFSSAGQDRAATQVHDIGVHIVRNDAGEIGYTVYVGGGLGRTPIIGKVVREFLPEVHLLSYIEAILRVYNAHGRRDNIHKARIKILVKDIGIEEMARRVEAEWAHLKDGDLTLRPGDIKRMQAFFSAPDYRGDASDSGALERQRAGDPKFSSWVARNTRPHRVDGYRIVFVSLKAHGDAPGDCTDHQMDALADLADQFSFGEVRTTHDQNLVLADVHHDDLYAVWQGLGALDLATPNIGTITDMICCPGLDFCSLANAGSIGVAQEIWDQFESLDDQYDIGELQIKMSGCMNGCGHHSVGHIGILGVDKEGEEWYQLTIGGHARDDAALGARIGPSLARDRVVGAVGELIEVYLQQREGDEETFLETVRRIGVQPFKDRVYGKRRVRATA